MGVERKKGRQKERESNIYRDVMAQWLRSKLMGQRYRVRNRHLPQWSWCAAGSLYNTVEHFRVERETYPWGKTRSKKPNWSERDKCEKAEKAFINDIFYFRKGPHIGCSVWCGWVCGGAGAGVPGGAPHPQDLYPLQLLPAPPGSVQQVLERKKTRQIKKSTVYLQVGFCFVNNWKWCALGCGFIQLFSVPDQTVV